MDRSKEAERMELEMRRLDITDDVLRYHRMADGKEREDEYRRLISITEELIDLVPIRSGYLQEDEACGFDLTERKNAPKMLDAYRISKLSYPDYISQILRVRVRNYMIHMHEEESDLKRLHYA